MEAVNEVTLYSETAIINEKTVVSLRVFGSLLVLEVSPSSFDVYQPQRLTVTPETLHVIRRMITTYEEGRDAARRNESGNELNT